MRPAQALQDANAPRLPHQQSELQNAGDCNAPTRRIAGVWKKEGDGERRHYGKIHQIGREGRKRETAARVQRAHVQDEEGDEKQIGKGDARQIDGQREFFRTVVEARREQRDELRRERPDDGEQYDLRDKEQRVDFAGEFLGRRVALLLDRHRIRWNESRVERAFAEDRAKAVGQALGDEEGVRDGARAHDRRLHGERQKARHAREQGEAADREQIANHRNRPSRIWSSLRSRQCCGQCREYPPVIVASSSPSPRDQ